MITNQEHLQLQFKAKAHLRALAQQNDVLAVFQQVVSYARQWPIHILLSQQKYLCHLLLSLTKSYNKSMGQVYQAQLRTIVQTIRQRKQNIGITWVDKFDYLSRRLNELLNYEYKGHQPAQPRQQQETEDMIGLLENYSKDKRQNMQVHPQNQKLLKMINQNKLTPTDNTCLGCCRQISLIKNPQMRQISTIYENQQIPDTGQFYSVINYDQNPSIDEDIRRHMCAALNAGGGYVFINGCADKKILGIQFKKTEQLELLYDFINNAKASLQPDFHKCSFVLRQLQVVNSPFSICSPSSGHNLKPDQIQQYTSQSAMSTQSTKRILRLQLWPDEPRQFYIEQKIKSNKLMYSFFIPHASSIGQVQAEHIYRLLVAQYAHAKSMKVNGDRYHRSCPVCLPHVSKKLLNTLATIETVKQSANIVQAEGKFKNMAVIVISSLKFENQFIKTFQAELQNKKILVELSKPFLKFTSSALRAIWLVSHECNFNDLNKVIKIADLDGKCSGIIVTRFIQINSGIINESKLTRLEVAFQQMFKYKAMKQSRFQKQYTNGLKKQKFYTYYCFQQQIQAVFAFIYLDGQGVRCDFVKQYHFKNEHKTIN